MMVAIIFLLADIYIVPLLYIYMGFVCITKPCNPARSRSLVLMTAATLVCKGSLCNYMYKCP